MQITIENEYSNTIKFKLNVNPSYTIATIKDKIYDVWQGSVPDTIRLVFGNEKDLKDDRTISKYNIHDGDTLMLRMRHKDYASTRKQKQSPPMYHSLMKNKDVEKLPAWTLPYVIDGKSRSLRKWEYGVTEVRIPVLPPKKKRKYDIDEIVNHIKILPKQSTERAHAIDAIIRSGNAPRGRSTIYECVKQAEADDKGVNAAAGNIIANKGGEPKDIMDLGLQYEGCHIDDALLSKGLTWKRSIVLNLSPVRFCESERYGDSLRQYIALSRRLYAKNNKDPHAKEIALKMRNNDYSSAGLVPIDICLLLGNSDMGIRMQEGSPRGYVNPNYQKLCRKFNLPELQWCLTKNCITELRINKLYFSAFEFPPPNKLQNERASQIVWDRLKSYIEQNENVGGSPVVCVGGRSADEKRFRCKVAYRNRKGDNEEKKLCPFNFSVQWDGSLLTKSGTV